MRYFRMLLGAATVVMAVTGAVIEGQLQWLVVGVIAGFALLFTLFEYFSRECAQNEDDEIDVDSYGYPEDEEDTSKNPPQSKTGENA